MLLKPIVGRWHLSPAQPHKCVYPRARAELAALITSSVPRLAVGPGGLGTLCCANHIYSASTQPGARAGKARICQQCTV